MIQDYHRKSIGHGGQRRESLSRLARLCRIVLVLTIVGGVSVGLWQGYRRLLTLPYFRVTEVRVEGNLQVASDDIVASLGLTPETSILTLDLPSLTRRVLKNPWIKEASIQRQLPLALTVRVVERVPEAVFIADRRYLLSADGVILAALEDGDLPTLPTLRAGSQHQVAVGDHVLSSEMAQGLSVWRQFQLANAIQGEQAHEIVMAGDGSYVVNLGPDMPVIRLRAQDLQEQLRRLGAALVAGGQPLTRFRDVDLRFQDRVVFTPVGGG